MKWIARATAATLASGLMVALALLGLWIADAGGRSAQADSGLEVGVDANPLFYPANTDTSVGTAEPCISRTSTGGTFDVDIYVRDVTNLMSFALTFEYDPDIVHVSAYDVQRFLAVGSTNVLDMSDCPGATGYCGLGAFDADKLNHFGDGVLATVTLDPQGPAGISPADLTGVELTDTQGDPIGGADIVNSEVGIDQPSSYCVPDEDLDGVPDDDDLCLGTPPMTLSTLSAARGARSTPTWTISAARARRLRPPGARALTTALTTTTPTRLTPTAMTLATPATTTPTPTVSPTARRTTTAPTG